MRDKMAKVSQQKMRDQKRRYYHGEFGGIIRKMSNVNNKKTLLVEVNAYITCPLCRGYLIDATTVSECLHSFCKSCIITYLKTDDHCPLCKHVINKVKPRIKSDKLLQDIVYKMVPKLYYCEMNRRKLFYKDRPEDAKLTTPEQRGEDVSGRLIFNPDDSFSLSLEYIPPGVDLWTILPDCDGKDTSNPNAFDDQNSSSNSSSINNANNADNNDSLSLTSYRRYLKSPALLNIGHLRKFLALKYNIDVTKYAIEICHRHAPLPENWTLIDVAYIYAWKRIAPLRFFYRITLEEQVFEAPPHDRPSTPGLGASLPPIEAETICTNVIASTSNEPALHNQNKVPRRKSKSTNNLVAANKTKEVTTKEKQPSSDVVMSTTTTPTTDSIPTATSTTITVATNTVATSMLSGENKQIKSPIKILKNPDGKYEVLRNPPGSLKAKEQTATTNEAKPSNPEFSVVSIGNGQNSNRVKITLKQCAPDNTSSKKPKIISSVLLQCSQADKDAPGAMILQQLQRDKEKHQAEKQEKQRRRVTFVERSSTEKAEINMLKGIQKKPGEQQEKTQFLQSFQLTAREPGSEVTLGSSPKLNETSTVNESNDTQNKGVNVPKKENNVVEISNITGDIKNKNNSENIGVNASGANKRMAVPSGIVPSRMNSANKQCSDVDKYAFNYTKNINPGLNITPCNKSTKVDVYTFSNDPAMVPAGAVKRKCPPGLPVFDLKKHKQHTIQIQTVRKHPVAVMPDPVVQINAKLSRKNTIDHVPPMKKLIMEAGPSRPSVMPNSKPSSSPILSNDTRNILDSCGLNIPASLSITLTAPKSPASQFSDPIDPKDIRKSALRIEGKVNPTITLNDKTINPRVLKAFKSRQISVSKDASSSKPRLISKQQERGAIQQRLPSPVKRKKDQNLRDILDLSGVKKANIHSLRIPQPVTKAKSTVKDMPNTSDQGEIVNCGGHRYYRAPPGSVTPAAHRVNDCSLPTSTRTQVYAPTLTSPPNSDRFNFPSLKSLYALSQAPNLQQFQMDTSVRLARNTEGISSNVSNTDNRCMKTNISGKSHIAAQCPPGKPARSSVGPLAVAITKQQQSNDKCMNVSRSVANETNKAPVFHNNKPFNSTESGQQLSVQTRYSQLTEINSRLSARSTNDEVNTKNVSKTSSENDSNLETSNDSKKQPDDSSRQSAGQQEAASPRVSSTVSPSPPPPSNTNSTNETSNHSDNMNTASNEITKDLSAPDPTKNDNTGAEISRSKSPASPDSSSVTVESQ